LQITGNIVLPNSKKGVYDYFIRDYQQNVRMILTEEVHLGSNQATMETTRASVEEPLFGQPGAGNELVQTRFAVASIPGQGGGTGWNNASIGSQVARVGKLAAKKTGPNALLKVMAGDQVSSTVLYFYKSAVVNSTTSNGLAADVLLSLGQAIVGSPVTSDLAKGGSSGITGLLGSSTPFNAAAAPDATNATGTAPKAYLTVLFFDERFNYVGENSTYQRVSAAGTSNASLTVTGIKAPRNGYAFVYLSNESDEMVYFDNFQVSHTRGRIIEENHYYAYGLKMAGISSNKVGDLNEGRLKNLYQCQGDYSEFDEETGWNGFDLRDYDPQTGRFVQADPFSQFSSPYIGMGNDPNNLTDASGGLSINFGTINTLGRIGVAAAGAVGGYLFDRSRGGNGIKGAAIGGGIALGATFIPPFDISTLAGVLSGAGPTIA
jgi:RHS repeat-associated protein